MGRGGPRRHGRGPWGGPPGGFGPGGGFGPPGFGPGGFGPRQRMRRGDVRAALLVLLDEEPRNGYGLMQEIEQRSDGMWRPSPGSVYPALQQLEDEGLVRATEAEGRKAYELTAEGRAYVEERREQLGEPWAGPAESVGDDVLDLRQLMQGLGAALMQVAQTGDESQIAKASKVMKDARTAIYRILSDEDAKD